MDLIKYSELRGASPAIFSGVFSVLAPALCLRVARVRKARSGAESEQRRIDVHQHYSSPAGSFPFSNADAVAYLQG